MTALLTPHHTPDHAPHHVSGAIITRPYANDDDFWRVRSLAIETLATTPPDFNWDIRHWDGERFHNADLRWKPEWSERARLWETVGGKLVGVAHADGGGSFCLQLHPDYRQIEEEMLAWAEEQLALPTADGRLREVSIAVYDYDSPRLRILASRGYGDTGHTLVHRRLRLGGKRLPEPERIAGYTLRSTRPRDRADCRRVAEVLNASFNRTFHSEQEFYNFSTQSPSYLDELNLVAEAADGSFAALVGCTVDTANRYGIFEPVCTHPGHRRKGLARSLMFEGLQRMQAQGAEVVSVGTGDSPEANQFYDTLGFTEAYMGRIWRKQFRCEVIDYDHQPGRK